MSESEKTSYIDCVTKTHYEVRAELACFTGVVDSAPHNTKFNTLEEAREHLIMLQFFFENQKRKNSPKDDMDDWSITICEEEENYFNGMYCVWEIEGLFLIAHTEERIK